ncbi:MAG: YkvA family protein [Bacteroidota bacterium]
MKKLAKYRRYFSESGFWNKLKNYAAAAGVKAVYSALLLFYAYKRKETPAWARRVVLGILGYFILPVDAIPDLGWLVGYTDDIGLLSMGLVMIAGHINEEVREQARTQLAGWFPEADETVLQSVDDKL